MEDVFYTKLADAVPPLFTLHLVTISNLVAMIRAPERKITKATESCVV
jgi:hypothetical protein